MDERDIYHDAAFLCVALFCDRCKTFLDSESIGITQDNVRWGELLGNAARDRGWLITDDAASKSFGYQVLCPNCRGEA